MVEALVVPELAKKLSRTRLATNIPNNLAMSIIYSYLSTKDLITKIRLLSKNDKQIVTNGRIALQGKTVKVSLQSGKFTRRIIFMSQFIESITFENKLNTLMIEEMQVAIDTILQLPQRFNECAISLDCRDYSFLRKLACELHEKGRLVKFKSITLSGDRAELQFLRDLHTDRLIINTAYNLYLPQSMSYAWVRSSSQGITYQGNR